MKTSIVIVNFNGKELLEKVLPSISKAKKLEKEIAIKYRDKGFATWSDALPYLIKK